ncbi:phage head closure protein [Halalkalibacter krulwichiae]|uniref:Phage head-tail joining protein n=1 Tax=Halalkalibacter krulwichiae TaxID=199441 RepID=A0A1X9MIL5_9BACI|nr:phage head closure protein [Halalkalibacter krulwichiae]ARK32133.1 hypothetical protein BkAM31D_21065 [Halalkalibacter krulwichiae]
MATPWSDVVYLISLVEGQDNEGFPSIVESEPKQVFANKKSVRSQEYYMAKQAGVELSLMFEVRSIDYNGEEQLIYNELSHDVERTYEKGEFIEVVCKRRSDDHGN